MARNLTNLLQELQNLFDLEQLTELAEKLEQTQVQVSTQVRSGRSLTSIPRRGNIPQPPTGFQPTVVTPPPDPKPLAQLVGGLAPVLEQLRELVEIPLKRPEIFTKLGLEPPKGVLLVGAPGTGKTLTARSLAQTLGVNYLSVVAPELISKYYGEAEAKLRQLFDQAAQSAPCLIFIDEIDALVPSRAQVEGEVEKRLVAQLLGLMDGFTASSGVILLAATNRPEAIDPALRRPGRFDREIYFPIPDPAARQEILRIQTAAMPLAENVDLGAIAAQAHGFVGADLKGLCQSAAFHALKTQVPNLDQVPEQLQITQADFDWALQQTKPASLRSLVVQSPQVEWSAIGGLESVKQELKEAIAGLLHPELYAHTHAQPVKGILLCGAPGTGKTLLAKAVATAAQANFMAINGAELLSKWVGESELAIRQLFSQARQVAPCVIFLDEIDTLAPARSSQSSEVSNRVIGQLLTQIDGIGGNEGLIIIAATNRKSAIDPALIRAGRIELHIQLDLPDYQTRCAILAVHNRDRPLDPNLDLANWAKITAGLSGADLAFLSNRAALFAIRRHQASSAANIANLCINHADFDQAWQELQANRSDSRNL
ncbi:MAG: AAA family ATPase [Pseudanabaenaceae cyanobacterium bins.68]|nr:AAA family ATPase [Pseudanabaenaceae cyanobacterium bins.68]